eukprot:GHUV01056063.1.p1 GENE.GHUV01056063.1~~GHUV01056063.1.p1  ORF type:complete len:118 (-),score=31.36 GHUV01056063.1:27-380(-)
MTQKQLQAIQLVKSDCSNLHTASLVSHSVCLCCCAAPKYDPMPIQQATEQQPAVAANNIPARDEPWDSLVIPEGTGLSSTGYKWRQNLSHVEVFVKLPATITPKQVSMKSALYSCIV